MQRVLLPLVCTLTACIYEEKYYSRYGCMGDPPPSPVPSVVTISGITISPENQMPLAGVAVTLQSRTNAVISGPITSDPSFSFQLNTVGAPVDGIYLAATAPGRVNMYNAPSRPIASDFVVEDGLAVISTLQRDLLAAGALGMPFTPGRGTVLLKIYDCHGNPVRGASVESDPAGVARYFDSVQPSMTATATDIGGVAMVANLPPGKATLTVQVMAEGVTFTARELNVIADAFTDTIIQP